MGDSITPKIIKYTIPGRPVTKKNSQRMVKNPKTGRWFPVPSDQYKKYEKESKEYLHPKPIKPIDIPVNIQCVYFIPLNKDGTIPKNAPDLLNLLEATCDILVKYKIIMDDNVSIVRSHNGSEVIWIDYGNLPLTYIEISTKFPKVFTFSEKDFEAKDAG